MNKYTSQLLDSDKNTGGSTAQFREHIGHFGASVNWACYGRPKNAISKTKTRLFCDFIVMAMATNEALSIPKPPC